MCRSDKHLFCLLPSVLSFGVVSRLRGHQANAGGVRRGVVPGEKVPAKQSGVFSATEALGELRPVLQCVIRDDVEKITFTCLSGNWQ